MAKVVVYKSRFCGYCTAAIRFLQEEKKQEVEVIDLSNDHEKRMELVQQTGHRTVPLIFVGETFIGGYDELISMERNGELDPLLSN
ncbi:MAG: glutaredoxin [Deltaproteobacteria bacterium]|nr:glutaredoxin [Deltaproteobacteria bacterium]